MALMCNFIRMIGQRNDFQIHFKK